MEKIKLQITSKLFFLYFESKLPTAILNALLTTMQFSFMCFPLKVKRHEVDSVMIIHQLEKSELFFKHTISIFFEDEQGKKENSLIFAYHITVTLKHLSGVN